MVEKTVFALPGCFKKMIDLKKSSLQVIILILLTAFFFSGSLMTDRDFLVEDEARYAEVLREMMADNHWVVPHLNGSYYPDKPPLYFWLAALFSLVTGSITPVSFLIINWFSALGLILTTYFFGRYLFCSLSGFIGALILLSSLLFLGSAQVARMDILFTLFITLALFSFYRGYREGKGYFYFLCYFFSALAVLTKGPLGFLFVFLPAGALLLHPCPRGGPTGGRFIRFFFGNPGLPVFVVLVFGWLLWAVFAGHGDFVKNIFSKQILSRAVESFQHKEPFYYYLLTLPPVFLPWFPFLPRAIKKGYAQRRREPVLFLFLWFITGFIVISLISCKIFIYLLPLLPPLALYLGFFFSEQMGRQYIPGKIFFIEGAAAVFFTFGIFATMPLLSGYRSILFTLLFSGLLLAGIFLLILKKFKFFLVLLFSGMAMFSLTAVTIFAPQLKRGFSPRPMGEKIRRYAEEGYRIASFRVTRGILCFYAGQTIRELSREELPVFFDSPGKKILIIKARDLKKLRDKFPIFKEQAEALNRYKLNNETYIFLPAVKINPKSSKGGPGP